MLLLSVNPILMHSLSLLLLLLPLPAILMLSIGCQFIISGLHSCLSAMLYYRVVITREVITGLYYILYT